MIFLKKKLKNSGFTLVEVMASVAILSIGLIGGLTAINYNLKNISAQEDRIIAAKLAEEGIELTRNIRDTNWLKGAAWDNNFGFSSVAPIITKTRISFFCGGWGTYSEHQGSNNWSKTMILGSDNCNVCKMVTYKLSTDPGDNVVCYSDNFGNTYSYGSNTYNRMNPRTEFYRLVTATQIDANSIKIESFVKYGRNGNFTYLPPIEETLYNWKP